MQVEQAIVIRLTGDYDVYTTPELESQLNSACDVRNVVLDFESVGYIDSTAIGALIRLRKRRIAAGLPEVRFAALSETVKRVLTLVALHDAWPCFDTVEGAVASFVS
jgi:anti-anti-sigma factor